MPCCIGEKPIVFLVYILMYVYLKSTYNTLNNNLLLYSWRIISLGYILRILLTILWKYLTRKSGYYRMCHYDTLNDNLYDKEKGKMGRQDNDNSIQEAEEAIVLDKVYCGKCLSVLSSSELDENRCGSCKRVLFK